MPLPANPHGSFSRPSRYVLQGSVEKYDLQRLFPMKLLYIFLLATKWYIPEHLRVHCDMRGGSMLQLYWYGSSPNSVFLLLLLLCAVVSGQWSFKVFQLPSGTEMEVRVLEKALSCRMHLVPPWYFWSVWGFSLSGSLRVVVFKTLWMGPLLV